ncbi:MAG TPA: ABC transporter permease [Azoarcus sp.]|nr:ABC transporter permease [Azoarcus sp.]
MRGYIERPAGVIRILGDWTLPHYAALAQQVADARPDDTQEETPDLSALGALDTAGARLLYKLLGPQGIETALADLPPERRALLATVVRAQSAGDTPPNEPGYRFGDLFARIGQATLNFRDHAIGLCGLIGLTLETFVRVLLQPRRWRVTSFAAHLEDTALDAVPIVALLTFLVGAVVAFLGATVLTDFGATAFTVDLVAFSFLREFGVLLAAILVAGRSSSAFAAQIGSMRANEEIDAIRVQGLSPIELLVLPRVLALVVALPLLTFIAMMSGFVGGMLVCAFALDISPTAFFATIESDVPVGHFLFGMAKAPIFAFLIALIGCNEGFKASGSAQSVGKHTTSAVVQSIFIVILIDALAALFAMEMGW